MRPRNLGELCGLLSARRDVAKAELRLRQPRTTANPGHPVLSTYMGYLALRARKQLGDASLLNELQQASTSFPALPGPTPLLALDNGAVAVGRASAIDAGEASEDGDSEDENLPGAPRTVWAWGGSFAVYQSQKRPKSHELLEILKREADMDFPTFLIKVLYAVYQVTPPCPQLDPQLLTEAKELWGLHTGKRAIEALTAKEEDTLDEVVGRPPVVRCRVDAGILVRGLF